MPPDMTHSSFCNLIFSAYIKEGKWSAERRGME